MVDSFVRLVFRADFRGIGALSPGHLFTLALEVRSLSRLHSAQSMSQGLERAPCPWVSARFSWVEAERPLRRRQPHAHLVELAAGKGSESGGLRRCSMRGPRPDRAPKLFAASLGAPPSAPV